MTNVKLKEYSSRLEAFVGMKNECLDDPNLVYILTQILGIKKEFETFHGELGLNRVHIQEQLADDFNFNEVATLQIYDSMKNNKDVKTELVVTSSNHDVGRPLKSNS